MHSKTDTRATKLAHALRGARVVLKCDWGFFDRGDAGTIIEYDREAALCRVKFDGGAKQNFPASMLEREAREFRYRSEGGSVSAPYPTEDAAGEAAEAAGLREWDVVEVRLVSRNVVTPEVEPC